MKMRSVVSLTTGIAICALAICARPASAQVFTLTFDEAGNGSYTLESDPTGHVNDPGFFQVDPNSGVVALTYALPSQIGPGCVGVTEFGDPTTISDGICFYNQNGSGFMAFYSDNTDGGE